MNDAVRNYEKAASETLDKHAPATQKTCRRRVRKPWYTSSIHETRRVRRRHEKKWRKRNEKERCNLRYNIDIDCCNHSSVPEITEFKLLSDVS